MPGYPSLVKVNGVIKLFPKDEVAKDTGKTFEELDYAKLTHKPVYLKNSLVGYYFWSREHQGWCLEYCD